MEETDTVCIANIGPRERRKRLIFGLVSLAASLAIAGALVGTGAAVAWRAALFLPLMSAGIGIFQWQAKT
jgi:hypothetical protein